jgi:hypothetical protein
MRHKKDHPQSAHAISFSVKKEMGKLRIARSARIIELNLDTTRTREEPSTTIRGIVDRIISAPCPGRPEEVQIAVNGPNRQHRELRIENVLTDENGDEVNLKKGAQVVITVTANPKGR